MSAAEKDYELWQQLGKLLYEDEGRPYSRVMNVLSNLVASAIAMHPQSDELLETFIVDLRERTAAWKQEGVPEDTKTAKA